MIEIMLNNMFKISDEISADAIFEMQRKIKAEQAQWKRRNSAQDRLGYSAQEVERQKKYYKPKKPKWMRRKLSDADCAILAQAW